MVALTRCIGELNSILVLHLRGVGPRVKHVDVHAELLEFRDNVDHAGVANVGAVLFEGHTEDEHLAAVYCEAVADHQLHDLVGHKHAHGVVDTASAQNHLGVVSDALRLVGEVVGVDADAVPSHESGAVFQEVPLRSGGFEHVAGVDSETVKNEGELVHKRDVDVALSVLDCLRGLGHLDAGGEVGSGFDDAAVDSVHKGGGLGRASAGHLFNCFKRVDLVARIDALGAVSAVKVYVELQSRRPLEHGYAVFFGAAGVGRGLINDDVARLEHGPDGRRSSEQRFEVGGLKLVDGGRNRHDEHICLAKRRSVSTEAQPAAQRSRKVCWVGLEGMVFAAVELVDA